MNEIICLFETSISERQAWHHASVATSLDGSLDEITSRSWCYSLQLQSHPYRCVLFGPAYRSNRSLTRNSQSWSCHPIIHAGRDWRIFGVRLLFLGRLRPVAVSTDTTLNSQTAPLFHDDCPLQRGRIWYIISCSHWRNQAPALSQSHILPSMRLRSRARARSHWHAAF